MADSWKKHLNADPLPWLMESNSYTKYRTMVDLLDMPDSNKQVGQTKKELTEDTGVQRLIAETAKWFPKPVTRHNDAKLSHYSLRVLADFGCTATDQGIKEIAKKALEHIDSGRIACRQELPEKGKGFSKPPPDSEAWHALPCDSPLITYALYALNFRTAEVMESIERIRESWEDTTGWFCHLFFVESMYKKLQVGCPMAGLSALQLFASIPELKESAYAVHAYEPIRYHWEYGRSIYYFGRSKKFWTLKYPFVWYNALYLAEVLSKLSFCRDELLLKELIDWIERSQDEDGRFTPNSMFMNYRGWDFAQKKEPSPWITFLCCRILKRYYSS